MGLGFDNATIGVVGGTRGMGRWLADFFRERGFCVYVSGRNTPADSSTLAELCQVIIVAVPISVTCDVIRELGPRLPDDRLLVDVASLKKRSVEAMLESSTCEVVGVHPLFGPAVESIAGENVVVCPGRGQSGMEWICRTFVEAGARVTVTTPDHHDRVMAVIQAINHLNTMIFGKVVRESGLSEEELERYSTPSFRQKWELLKRIDEHPELYRDIITHNEYVESIGALYLDATLELMNTLIKEIDIAGKF
ncbi:MAG: prephenate dehydrogenase/arogenate dehydrogenase family protein [Syntrophales bacterium]|nr:prephenate dehydrogenase/arogenate dehydrogenase family protein [Syntrophales bacterium]